MDFYHNLLCKYSYILAFTVFRCCASEYGPGYGTNWLYFVDEYGKNHIMNFSSVPNDTDMAFGNAYFYLYTRPNIDEPEKISIPKNSNSFLSNHFNKLNDIRVLTHGWLSSENMTWLQNIKNTLLKKFDLNVITVDWSELSKNIVYPYAAFSTRYVGKRIALLLHALRTTYNYTNHIHLIGHSLGAQVMGYAGMFSKEKVNRVTGLDPARPLFEIPKMPPDFCLDASDAIFVDIIHTCGGIYGYMGSYGDADFYPNEGRPPQPGCEGSRQVIGSCSHNRVNDLFEESIEHDAESGFLAYPCDSWEHFEAGKCVENGTSMGYLLSQKSKGNYFLHTRNESKYA